MQQQDDVPLTPMVVDCVTFDRAPLGRRGYNEDQVDDFLDRIHGTLCGTDKLSAADVREVIFDSAPLIRRGYHEEQVDDFLDLVVEEFDRRERTGVGRPPSGFTQPPAPAGNLPRRAPSLPTAPPSPPSGFTQPPPAGPAPSPAPRPTQSAARSAAEEAARSAAALRASEEPPAEVNGAAIADLSGRTEALPKRTPGATERPGDPAPAAIVPNAVPEPPLA